MAVIQVLISDKQPYRLFNLTQLRDVGALKRILAMLEVILTNFLLYLLFKVL